MQVAPGVYIHVAAHGVAAVGTVHAPVQGWQQMPVDVGQGFGEQDVAELEMKGVGHGVPSATVWHAPVVGLQHTCCGVTHVTAEQG